MHTHDGQCKADMELRHVLVLLRWMPVVEQLAELNGGYENWKKNAETMPAEVGKRLGCIDCFENIPDAAVAITEQNKESLRTAYIHTKCLDKYWKMYKEMKR